ncbi:hypothetical protein GCM10027040_30540 [Halomonas shantousis]
MPTPTLGDLLGDAKRSTTGFQAWIEATDPELAEEAGLAARRAGTSLAGLARAAIADFSRFADPHAWAQLTSRISNSSDPGATCLALMVRWQLTDRRLREQPSLARETRGDR